MGPVLKALLLDEADDGETGQIDFRSLSVREFGTIYEGLLESSLSVATQDLTVDSKGAWIPASKSDQVLSAKGDIYFHSASGERKATGSYFTPSVVVDNLITERHGDLIKFHRGDAMLAPTRQGTLKRSLVFGVMSADCVPIIVRAEHGWGLIHAGWRGLANGIIESVVGALGEPLEAVIGPSAGPKAYEVGLEVVEAIGASAVFDKRPGHSHKALLDTAATAIRQLHNANSSISAHNASICTISDPRFHSFRRDGASAGRGITFVLPGS